jgi:hypothetical protein
MTTTAPTRRAEHTRRATESSGGEAPARHPARQLGSAVEGDLEPRHVRVRTTNRDMIAWEKHRGPAPRVARRQARRPRSP